jgi:SpoIIAA-like
MFTPINQLPKGVIGFEAHGRVTRTDRQEILAPSIAAARASGKKVKLLYVTGSDFAGYDQGTLFDDAIFGTCNFASFERIAFVGEESPYSRAIDALDGLMPAALRRFAPGDLQSAKTWLAA